MGGGGAALFVCYCFYVILISVRVDTVISHYGMTKVLCIVHYKHEAVSGRIRTSK